METGFKRIRTELKRVPKGKQYIYIQKRKACLRRETSIPNQLRGLITFLVFSEILTKSSGSLSLGSLNLNHWTCPGSATAKKNTQHYPISQRVDLAKNVTLFASCRLDASFSPNIAQPSSLKNQKL